MSISEVVGRIVGYGAVPRSKESVGTVAGIIEHFYHLRGVGEEMDGHGARE